MPNIEPGLRVVSRAGLYEQVWRTPATKLAAEYGVSNVAIIKACKRHEIPRPPRGFWAMIQHGYEVEHRRHRSIARRHQASRPEDLPGSGLVDLE